MSYASTLTPLTEIAQDQWGLITRKQAELAGVPTTTLGRLTSTAAVLTRVAHGVYRLAGTPLPDHLELRAAWLQLAPAVLAWDRIPEQGLVSHRSAAVLYGLGELTADRHEFSFRVRRQTRRSDVRIHLRAADDVKWINLRGMLVTRPSQIAADLLLEREDPETVARIVAEAIRNAYDHPADFTESLAPHSAHFGLRHNDGYALLSWLLDLAADPESPRWLAEARARDRRTLLASESAGTPA